MFTIKKNKYGTYSTVIYLGVDASGKKIQKKMSHKDKKVLRMMANEYVAAHRLPTGVTMGMAMDGYIEAKDKILSPSTIRGYQNISRQLKKRFPIFMAMKLDMVNGTQLQDVVDSLAASGMTPKSVRNYFGLISAVFTWKRIRMDVVVLPKKVRTEIQVPEDDDVRRAVEAAAGTELEIPILLAATCGMRRGEICALRYPDDFQGNICHISKDMVMGPDRQWHIKPPKTFSSDRFVEVPEFVMDRIREKGSITDLTPHSLTDVHRRFLQAHGLKSHRFHDYRHYMVSTMHAAGIPDHYIMQRGGWSSDNVMKSVYRHTLADRDEEATRAANAHFQASLNTGRNR